MSDLMSYPQATVVTKMLDPVSAANTAAATSGWVQSSNKEGTIEVTAQVGAITGTIAWSMEDATDSGGSGSASMTGILNEGAFGAVTANNVQKRTFPARACRGWFRIIGTIGTGPSLVAVSFRAHPKNT